MFIMLASDIMEVTKCQNFMHLIFNITQFIYLFKLYSNLE
jgi:hypothetical protein